MNANAAALGVLLICSAGSSVLAAGGLDSRPDSISQTLQLDIDRTNEEELRAAPDLRYRLQTSADLSVLSWKQNRVVYTYEIRGDRHEERGLWWLLTADEVGIRAFVAERRGEKRNFVEFRRVRALEIGSGTRR